MEKSFKIEGISKEISTFLSWGKESVIGYKTKSAKVRCSPSKKIVIVFTSSKDAFYLILKALFVLKIFRFLPCLFGQIGKMA